MKSLCLLILVFSLLSGCSTYSKQECQVMDQSQLGYLTGASGESSYASALIKFQKNCSEEYDLKTDEEKMKQGWLLGIHYYCSEEGGNSTGMSGKKYSGVCSKEEEKNFFKTYNPARMSFLEKRIVELESEVAQAQSIESALNSRLGSCESELSSARTPLPTTCN